MAYKYCIMPGCNAPAVFGERKCFNCTFHPKPIVKIAGVRIPTMPAG